MCYVVSICSGSVGCSSCFRLLRVVFGGCLLSYVGMNSSVAPLRFRLSEVVFRRVNLFKVVFG